MSSGILAQGALVGRDADTRHRAEKINGDAMTLAGRSDAAYRTSPAWGNADWDMMLGLCRPTSVDLAISSNGTEIHSEVGEKQSGW